MTKQQQKDFNLIIATMIMVATAIIIAIISIISHAIIKNNMRKANEEIEALKNYYATSNSVVETTKVSTSVETVVDTTTNVNTNTISLKEKYNSVFTWQKYGGDFGVEQLEYLNTQCEKYDIPMEIMLSVICQESGFRSNAKATTSSASGYCQIIKGTAKWMYEDWLRYGTYDVNNHREIMTTNWELNLEIACRYMAWLYKYKGNTWENAIKGYYGSTSASENEAYLNKVNGRMTELFGLTVTDFEK